MGRACTRERASETRSRWGIAIELGRDKKKPSGACRSLFGAVKRGEGADNTIPVRQKMTNGAVGFKLTEGDQEGEGGS